MRACATLYRYIFGAILAFISIGLTISCSSADAQELQAIPIQVEEASGGTPGQLGIAAAQAIIQGPLSNDPAELARAKALSPRELGIIASPKGASRASKAVTRAPAVVLGNEGLSDNGGSPSDSTGAIGSKRYIELINSKVGIYNLKLKLLNENTLDHLFKEPGGQNFDPQIIWDAYTNRFYYAGDSVFGAGDNRLAFGFSKTARPTNATTDWCHYQLFRDSPNFTDYPKLGDSKGLIVLGDNVFDSSGEFLGSAIQAISKPPAGTSCPGSLPGKNLMPLSIGLVEFVTPVPANEIDDRLTSRIVAEQIPKAKGSATEIGLFNVKTDQQGAPVFSAGSVIDVQPYKIPPDAPQEGSSFLLDTLDARMTQAVAAIDPLRGKFAIWTQHTIAGGAGSQIRWYELDPNNGTVLQSGDLSDPSLFLFNAAITPDRVVNGTTTAFGSNMVLNFDASSSSNAEAIEMVSKRGNKSISLPTVVQTSTGPDTDSSCSSNGVCRWGDYAAGTPDPNSPTSARAGIVWGSSMWTASVPGSGDTPSWRTWNWKSQD